eukprot:766712-Hanusia_phi.AAC.1
MSLTRHASYQPTWLDQWLHRLRPRLFLLLPGPSMLALPATIPDELRPIALFSNSKGYLKVT